MCVWSGCMSAACPYMFVCVCVQYGFIAKGMQVKVRLRVCRATTSLLRALVWYIVSRWRVCVCAYIFLMQNDVCFRSVWLISTAQLMVDPRNVCDYIQYVCVCVCQRVCFFWYFFHWENFHAYWFSYSQVWGGIIAFRAPYSDAFIDCCCTHTHIQHQSPHTHTHTHRQSHTYSHMHLLSLST